MSESNQEYGCPACGAERTDCVDVEAGDYLPNCPNCGVTDVPELHGPDFDPPSDVSQMIDYLCEDRIGGAEVRDDERRRNLRIALMRLIDARIRYHLRGLELDDLV